MIAPTAVAVMVATALAPSGLPVLVRGTSVCPTAEEIAARLPELLPETGEMRPDVAWIEAADSTRLSITLRSPEGGVLIWRQIDRAPTCAATAQVAAVIIATWQMERHPGLSLLQPAPRARVVANQAAARSPPVKPDAGGLALEVGAGAGAVADSAGVAPAARLEVGLMGRLVGFTAALSVDSARDLEIAGGTVVFRRAVIATGPVLIARGARMALQVHGRMFAGMTSVRGRGYDVDRSDGDVSIGFAPALRIARATGRLRSWIEVSGRVWRATGEVLVLHDAGPPARRLLPRVDFQVGAGMALWLGRRP